MDTNQILRASAAAVQSGARVGGPTMQVGDLVSGIVVLAKTCYPAWSPEAANTLGVSLATSLVMIVGKRRAAELVNAVSGAGADDGFA